jgi:hypothetical protein
MIINGHFNYFATMKATTYTKFFQSYDSAYSWMRMKNKHSSDIFCLVNGPSDNYAVVDLDTAIELGIGYEFTGK